MTVDAYFVVRNAGENGVLSVLAEMQKYRDDVRVLGVGLQRIAGSLLEGKEVQPQDKTRVLHFMSITSPHVCYSIPSGSVHRPHMVAKELCEVRASILSYPCEGRTKFMSFLRSTTTPARYEFFEDETAMVG